MINLIVLDTNILRSMGATFFSHVDYKSLEDYCYSSASEIVIPKTVLYEYMDFYEREILDKNLNEINRAYEKLKRLHEFQKIRPPKLETKKEAQLDYIYNELTLGKLTPNYNFTFKEEELVFFLLESKRETGKDNTRDFLIWLTTIVLGLEYPNDRIILISNDKIFTESAHLKKYQEIHEVENLEIFSSIPSFLSEFGFKSNKLTEELILESINPSTIETELLADKDSIPSHISGFYNEATKSFELIDFKIENIRIESFYSHKEKDSGKVKVIAHVEVLIYMRFEPESNLMELKNYLKGLTESEKEYSLETFDDNYCPVFHDEILFHFELTFDEASQKITESKFLDFFPDYPRSKKIRRA